MKHIVIGSLIAPLLLVIGSLWLVQLVRLYVEEEVLAKH